MVLSLVAVGCSNNNGGASNTPAVKGNDVAPANNAGNKPKEGEEFVLAFTSPALTSPAYAYMLAGLKEVLAVEGQGIKLTVQSPAAESDAGAQVSIVENFISLGVDAIAISATNNDAIAPVVVKANNVSIPVFAFNTPVPKIAMDSFTLYRNSKDTKFVFLNEVMIFLGDADCIAFLMCRPAWSLS